MSLWPKLLDVIQLHCEARNANEQLWPRASVSCRGIEAYRVGFTAFNMSVADEGVQTLSNLNKKLRLAGICAFLVIGALRVLPARAIQQSPAQTAADSEAKRLRQIQQLIQSGQLDEARDQVEEALKAQPGDGQLYNFLGVIHAQAKDFGSAESSFRRAIQLAPRLTSPYLNLGRLYQEHAAVDKHAEGEALQVYKELLEFEPAYVEANYQAAWLSNRLGAFVTSQRYLDRLPSETRQRPQSLALRCANYVAIGQSSLADSTSQQLLAQTNLVEEDTVPIVAALAKHHEGEFPIHFLETLNQRGLASAAALQELASLYEAGGRLNDARGILERAFQASPSSWPLLFQLARVAYLLGDREGTLGYLAHARELDPQDAAVHFFFGMVCVELNLLPDAKKSLEEAVRLSPDNAYYNYALGATLVQANQMDEAIGHFQKFRELRPVDPHARLALAVAYFYSFRYDEARAEFQAIADRKETQAGAHLFLGRMEMQDRKFGEAIEHFKKSIAADPSVSEAYTDLGLVYLNEKEYSLAESTLDHAIQLAPDDYLSNQRLLTLYLRTNDPRADTQKQLVDQLRETGQEKEHLLMRTLEVKPY